MREARESNRVSFQCSGVLHFEGKDIEMQTVNLSNGGACISVSPAAWATLGDCFEIAGRFPLEGSDLSFHGRICWSSETADKVFFGIAFMVCNFEVLRNFFERKSLVEEHRPDAFNL